MKTIGGLPFPETKDEADAWRPIVRVKVLHRNVLCVARTRVEGKWAAYCGPVEGRRHEEEYDSVLTNGDKMDEPIAKAMFQEFAEIPYAH